MSEPIVKYVPEWFPGAGFKRTARKWWALQETIRNKPFKMVLDKRVGLRYGYIAGVTHMFFIRHITLQIPALSIHV